MSLLMHREAFFHINLKLYIWEIAVQQQSPLCFSVWPSAITRTCGYNLAQVKFNQSPQAQRNLCLPGKKEEEGEKGEEKGKGEEEGKGEGEKGERDRKLERVSLHLAQGSCRSF